MFTIMHHMQAQLLFIDGCYVLLNACLPNMRKSTEPFPLFFLFMFLTLYENRRAAKIQKLTTDKLTWWKVSCQLKRIISGIILNSSWLCITSRPALSQGDCFIGCLCTVHQILSHMIWYASLKTTMCFRNHFRYCTTSSGMHINSFRILICSKAFILRKICV